MNQAKTYTRRNRWTARFAAAAAVVTAGSLLQIPSCRGVLTTFNPCGTVFGFCDARDIDALFGDVPDFGLDPTCTIPFFGINNPGEAGGGGGGGGGGGIGGGTNVGTCAGSEVFTTPGPRP